MRFVYALSLRWRCPKQANTMCHCERSQERVASNRVGRSKTVDCFALLAMTEKSFCFVILKPLAAEESQSIRIQWDCFASPQHDKIPCVIASERCERGNQQCMVTKHG